MAVIRPLMFSALVIMLIGVCSNAKASCDSEMHRAFDFWVGEWSVSTQDGQFAGENSIQKIQNGCVLQENWRSAKPPFTGTSFNFYNQQAKRWEQLWLDNQGGYLKLYGERNGNNMVLQSEPNDKGAIDRVTWTENQDGTVRQLWERVSKEKAVVVFDGLYRKKNLEKN